MHMITIVMVFLACRCNGRSVGTSNEQHRSSPSAECQRSVKLPGIAAVDLQSEGAVIAKNKVELAMLLLAFNSAPAFNVPCPRASGSIKQLQRASSMLKSTGHRVQEVGMSGAEPEPKGGMERPALDKVIAKGFETFEKARVDSSLVENEDGSLSEPLEWAEPDSLAQRVSKLSQVGPLAMFKQFIADRLAGDFDEDAVAKGIDEDIASNTVLMYSFSTCPFCLKAKKVLDEKEVDYKVRELDVETDGYAIRAILGRRTGRTSMPSVWVKGTYVGGANDGGLGGVVTLETRGELEPLLKEVGAI